VTVYVFHMQTPGATACQFKIEQQGGANLIWLFDSPAFPVYFGNSQTGAIVAYGACLSGPIHVMTISYFGNGISPTCSRLEVVGHPTATPPGLLSVDCAVNILEASGCGATVNPDAGCMCDPEDCFPLPECEQPILSLVGYSTVSWVDPLWEVQVEVHNAGSGVARNVNVIMMESIPWLIVPDPNCSYGDIPAGGSSLGNDSYTFDLTSHPGGSFNVRFDVSYEDSCGNQYNVRLDPEFEPRKSGETPDIPDTCRLSQNYPNPFNPNTTISFQIPVAGRVSLQVFDASGRLVRTLVNEYKDPGLYAVDWDGKDNNGAALVSGVYFYKIQTGAFKETRKMVLIR
jgi:hypothetical protein